MIAIIIIIICAPRGLSGIKFLTWLADFPSVHDVIPEGKEMAAHHSHIGLICI